MISPKGGGARSEPLLPSRLAGSAYGVGSAYEPPKMLLLPKPTGHSALGAGGPPSSWLHGSAAAARSRGLSATIGSASPLSTASTKSCRYSFMAGHTAPSRMSFHTAAPKVRVATA